MVKLDIKVLVGCWLLLACMCVKAENFQLKGQICDIKGQGIFAANVYLSKHYHPATASDENGCFLLNIPIEQLADSLVVSFIGYKNHQVALKDLPKDEAVYIVLHEDWTRLDAVVLEHNPEVSEEFSLEKLGKLDIYLSPVAAGDPLNALTVLPAATNTSESANPSFRGSEAIATQVVLNGINISNPVRNTQMSGMGNFSLFNTELIQSLSVHAGNPPLSYGNSIAGIVDLKSNKQLETSQTQIAASLANIGIMRSQKITQEAFVQVYGNCQFSQPYLHLNDCKDMLTSFSSRDIGVNTHVRWKASSFNYYAYFINEDFQAKEHYQHQVYDSEAWKRRGFGVFNWHYAHERCFLEVNAGHQHSKGRMQLADIDAMMTETNYQLNGKIKYFVGDALYLQAGLSNEWMQIQYRHQDGAEAHRDSLLGYQLPEIFGYLRWKKGSWSMGLGSRRMLWNPQQDEPAQQAWQMHLRYQMDHHSSLQASAGKYYAYLSQQAGDGHVDLQHAWQSAIEYDGSYGNTHLSAACYYKIENGDLYLEHLQQWQAMQKRIWGCELSCEQNWDGLKLSSSYTYLHSRLRWGEALYPAANDLPYWLKTQISYTNDRFFTIACSAQWRAGLRYTPVKEGRWEEDRQMFMPVYGTLNEARLQHYQRFDLSLNKVYTLEQGMMLVAFVSMNNIFNHHNQAAVLYHRDYSAQSISIPMQGYSIYFGLQWSF